MKNLTKEQYEILRKKSTEPPFTGKLLYNKEKGEYHCAFCGNILFSSKAKYDSGSGWPSFYEPSSRNNIIEKKEKGLFGRMEIICSRCKGHLGHVFKDGPNPTGLRYCINSAALNFRKSDKLKNN